MPVIYELDRKGNGVKFIAANSNYITLANNPILDFQYNSNFSISFEVIPVFSATTQCIICNLFGGASFRGWALFYNTSTNIIGFWITANGTVTRNYIDFHSAKKFEGKLHFTFIKSGTSLVTDYNMYLNNELIANKAIFGGGSGTLGTNTISYTSAVQKIGILENSLYLDSYLYHLGIADRAITAAENAKLFRGENANFKQVLGSNVISNWGFNEKSGTVLNDDKGVSAGTLVNFANTALGSNNQHVNKKQVPIAA